MICLTIYLTLLGRRKTLVARASIAQESRIAQLSDCLGRRFPGIGMLTEVSASLFELRPCFRFERLPNMEAMIRFKCRKLMMSNAEV